MSVTTMSSSVNSNNNSSHAHNGDSSNQSTLDHAQSYRRAGFSVLPIKRGATRSPRSTPGGNLCSVRRPKRKSTYGSATRRGGRASALPGGTASGNLLVLDFEFADYFEEWSKLVEADAPGLTARLPQVMTPGKDETSRGRHVYVRSSVGPIASGKLAKITCEEAERRTGDPHHTTAIETRGQGGDVLAVGCPADCHPSGRLYEHVAGTPPPEETPTLTEAEVDLLLVKARVLDCDFRADVLAVTPPPPDKTLTTPPGGGVAATMPSTNDGSSPSLRPGDDFERRGRWEDILVGWAKVGQIGDVTYLCRPGKPSGVSATIGHCKTLAGDPKLYIFSTNASPFEVGKSYSLFQAFALLQHGGDFSAAAKDLGEQGYGSPLAERDGHIPRGGSGKRVEAAAGGGGNRVGDDPRPAILITTEEHLVNAAAVVALANDPGIFQRGRRLARVVHLPKPKKNALIKRPEGLLVIDAMPCEVLQDRLAVNVRWLRAAGGRVYGSLSPPIPPRGASSTFTRWVSGRTSAIWRG